MVFDLNEKEEQSIKEWIIKQKEKKDKSTTIGGRFSYIFTPTGIGIGITIKDNLLYETFDATDYDCW